MTWPEWWEWELELTEDVVPGRFVIETRRMDEPWEVIVDPDADERLLVVVTAYAGDR